MEDQSLYQLALTRIKGIGPVHTKNLISKLGDAAAVFGADRNTLRRSGLSDDLITAILDFPHFSAVRDELRHLRAIGTRIIFYTDPDYPRRLLPHSTAPALLFFKGAADLNAEKIIAIAGTRRPTDYGKQTTARLVRDLARPNLLIVSGLAFGIDAVAHEAALRHHVPTVGVMGHGVDHIYPAEHSGLSRAMLRDGGLLTSFFHELGPESHTFPLRNKLIAELCDALIIIESDTGGGSMSTADYAWGYRKKIFALPGRITDKKSLGCLQLIHQGRALPLLSASQLTAAMGWDCPSIRNIPQPILLFSSKDERSATQTHPTPPVARPADPGTAAHNTGIVARPPQPPPEIHSHSPLETQLLKLLNEQQPLSFDDLINLTNQPIPSISVALLNLEIRGVIRSLPGRRYHVAG